MKNSLKAILFFMFVVLLVGCKGDQAKSMLEDAMSAIKAGDVEKSEKILLDLAQNHTQTEAGQVAINIINQRVDSANRTSRNDLKNFRVSLEAYSAKNNKYPNGFDTLIDAVTVKGDTPSANSQFSSYASTEPDKVLVTNGVEMIFITDGTGSSYEVCGFHQKGSIVYCANSIDVKFFEIKDIENFFKSVAEKNDKLGEAQGVHVFKGKGA